MEMQSIARQAFRNCLGKLMFLTFAVISFQCAENDPAQLAPGERPETVAWITVKTGLVRSKKDPENGVSHAEYVMLLNRAGFSVSWGASKGAAYYEVRASRAFITSENWSRAYFAAKVSGDKDTIRVVIDRIQPSICGRKCTGCRACISACPRHAITLFKGKAVINPDSCIGCSMCYDKCTFSAVSDENLTKFYHFAVRAFSNEGVPAEEATCTNEAYKSRYTNVAYKPSTTIPWCGFCGGTCYILDPSKGKNINVGACPVDAVYFDPNPDINDNPGRVYIDQSKCIACGLCVEQCSRNCNGNWWPFRREVVSSKTSLRK